VRKTWISHRPGAGSSIRITSTLLSTSELVAAYEARLVLVGSPRSVSMLGIGRQIIELASAGHKSIE
jgi:hypothetical protein